jgi:hypothetical protein
MGRVFDMFCQSVLSPLFHHIIELAEEGSEASWNWDHWHGVHYFFYILFFVFFLSRRGRLRGSWNWDQWHGVHFLKRCLDGGLM